MRWAKKAKKKLRTKMILRKISFFFVEDDDCFFSQSSHQSWDFVDDDDWTINTNHISTDFDFFSFALIFITMMMMMISLMFIVVIKRMKNPESIDK